MVFPRLQGPWPNRIMPDYKPLKPRAEAQWFEPPSQALSQPQGGSRRAEGPPLLSGRRPLSVKQRLRQSDNPEIGIGTLPTWGPGGQVSTKAQDRCGHTLPPI